MSELSANTVSIECDERVAKKRLLDHPFYVAWSEGRLPVAALKAYAREYGAFVAAVPDGWRAAGDAAHAREEEHHARVWRDTFAGTLGESVSTPSVREVTDLLALSKEMFSSEPTAAGALYAFETQQPDTARSKLEGLLEFYPEIPAACREYFVLHDGDYGEREALAGKMNRLAPKDRQRAIESCERMAGALYDALTGIHAPFAC
jgi:pyrroloquinoline-quinone synthase